MRIDLDFASRKLEWSFLSVVAAIVVGVIVWRSCLLWSEYQNLAHARAELARVEALLSKQTRERQANEQAAKAEPFEHPLHAYPWADVIKSVPRFSGIDGVRLMSFEHSVAERRSRYTLEVTDERALAALVDLVGPKSANPVRIVEQHQVEAGGQRHFQLVLEADGKPAQ